MFPKKSAYHFRKRHTKKFQGFCKLYFGARLTEIKTMICLQELRPLLVSMKILGLFYEPGVTKNAVDNTDASFPDNRDVGVLRKGSFRGSQYYCVAMCCILWVQVLRYVPSFWVGIDYEAGLIATRIVVLVWALQCALNATIIYRGCKNPNQFQTFRKLFADHLAMSSSGVVSESQISLLRKRSITGAVLCWAFFFINNLSIVLFLLNIIDQSEVYVTILTTPFGKSLVSQIVCFLFYLPLTAAWVFPIAFSCLLCTVLSIHFQALTAAIEVRVAASGRDFLREVESFRHHHVRLSACVRALDAVLRRVILASYLTNLPLICFLLYQMVTYKPEGFALFVMLFWLVVNSFSCLMISLYTAVVHEEAHSQLDVLYEVRTLGAETFQVAELQLFISKLSGPSIGFTVLGIITVSKEMIFTLGGILTSYFFLLLQYQI